MRVKAKKTLLSGALLSLLPCQKYEDPLPSSNSQNLLGSVLCCLSVEGTLTPLGRSDSGFGGLLTQVGRALPRRARKRLPASGGRGSSILFLAGEDALHPGQSASPSSCWHDLLVTGGARPDRGDGEAQTYPLSEVRGGDGSTAPAQSLLPALLLALCSGTPPPGHLHRLSLLCPRL